jgi:pimeloyl-ACP methyl ester carboxylesterase
MRLFKVIGSREDMFDEEYIREVTARSFARDHDPVSVGRQLGAVMKTGKRDAMLRTISAPTLVIHGTRDKLILPSGGKATAKAIPNARLMMIEGMGHDLPRAAWPQIMDGIAENAARAGGDSAKRLAA